MSRFPFPARQPIAMLIIGWLGLCLCDATQAVVITLKDGRRLGGWVIEKDQDRVIVDVVSQSGTRNRENFRLADIDDVSYAVSAARLAELNPAEPLKYKRYAEELAEITIDPEARPMSLRLYHMALMLDPDQLRDSCLLGMIAIARDREEERRLRAAAFLYRRERDESLITSRTEKQASGRQDTEQDALLKLLRDLRTGTRSVIRDNEIPLLRTAFSPFTDAMTDDEISQLFVVACDQCTNGFIDCPYCERGIVVRANRRTRCTRCQRGQIPCPACRVGSGSRLSDDLLKRIVSAEIQILQGTLSDTATKAAGVEDDVVSWSQIRPSERTRTIPALSLRNLTEFDPAKCVFRDGQWVRPAADE